MVSLRKAKPKPEAMYESVSSYAVDGRVYRAGIKLRGDHPEVRARFGAWMLDELPDDEKSKLRAAALWTQTIAEPPEYSQPAPDPVAQPPSGRFRALRSWTLADPDLQRRYGRINAGQIVDASDEVYRRYPHLFAPDIEERGR